MPCYRPIRVAIQRQPQRVGGRRTRDMQQVPCGNCLGCRALQTYQWAIRLSHEVDSHAHAWFITLTYDEENLPENGSLDPYDLESFHTCLREATGQLTYYGVGEYGDQHSRPHYHTLCFGFDIPDRTRDDLRPDALVWQSEAISDLWRYRGRIEIGTVTPASAAYVAGYVRKKVAAMENPNLYQRVIPETGEIIEVHPEFSRMSRRPAIGKRWIQRHWRDVYAHDRVVIDGRETKPPRYYDKWMETDHQEDADNTCKDCDEHRDKILEVKFNRWDPDHDDSKEKRLARQTNHERRLALFSPRNAF